MTLHFRRLGITLASTCILLAAFTFSDSILNVLVTPLPKNMQSCITDKLGNSVEAQAACTGITNTDSVAVWNANGTIRESSFYLSGNWPNQNVGVGTSTLFGESRISVVGTGDNNDSAFTARNGTGFAFGILPWSNGVHLSSGAYFTGGGWARASGASNRVSALSILPGTGAQWYADATTASVDWDIANRTLWNDTGTWTAPISSTSPSGGFNQFFGQTYAFSGGWFDADNINYYVDPNTTTSLNTICVGLCTNSTISRNASNGALTINRVSASRTNNEVGGGFGGTFSYTASAFFVWSNHYGQNLLNVLGNGNYAFRGSNVSDIRLKKDIVPITGALDKTIQLQGVEYNFTDPQMDTEKRYIGLIAQDVQKVVPQAVTGDDSDGMWGVRYTDLVALLIEAFKEMYAEVKAIAVRQDKQEAVILKQQQLIEAQQKQITNLEKRVDALSK